MTETSESPGILIVDDQQSALGMLETTLATANYRVYTANSGEAAVRVANEKQPELIILDTSMPGQDGLEICRRLKSDPETQGIAVMFLSAVTDADIKAKGLGLGAVDYVHKPFDPSELRARIQAHLRLNERLDRLRKQHEERCGKIASEAKPSEKEIPGVLDQECVTKEEKTIVFKTDAARVQGIVNQLLVGVNGHFDKKSRNDLALGIHEMVLNAVEHGNLGITSEAKSKALENQTFTQIVEERMETVELAEREVTIQYSFDGSRVRYHIVDEGAGFDWTRFLERDEPEDLLASNGRGILISRYIFDRIEYNEVGNVVTLEKRIR